MIMKKEYISPQTDIDIMAPVMPLAASTLDSNATSAQTISVSEEEVSEFTSRRRDVWEDEYEEEQGF